MQPKKQAIGMQSDNERATTWVIQFTHPQTSREHLVDAQINHTHNYNDVWLSQEFNPLNSGHVNNHKHNSACFSLVSSICKFDSSNESFSIQSSISVELAL